MKKIFVFLAVLVFCSTVSFAAEIEDKLTSTQLSNQVSGTYFSDATGTGSNDATNYVISTGHAQGDKVYASGNFVVEIYFKDISGDKFASSDLITSMSSFDSSSFSAFTSL